VLACKTSTGCVDGGAPVGSVCCAHNDGTKLLNSECMNYASCDAHGPQDWLCDPNLVPPVECTDPKRASCQGYPLPAPIGLAICGG
jgi:hypothetical protein